jgi:hypothetical protein
MPPNKKTLNNPENDPDCLQIKDECDKEWVNCWHKTLEDFEDTSITFILHQNENQLLKQIHQKR